MHQANFFFFIGVGVDGHADSAVGGDGVCVVVLCGRGSAADGDVDGSGNRSVVGSGGIGDIVCGVIGWWYLWWCCCCWWWY